MDRNPQPIFTNRMQIGGHTKEYREFAPHAALKPYVACFWTCSSFGKYLPTYVTRVLPDGCPEIIFDNCKESSGTRGVVVGIMAAPGMFRYEGVIDTVAVRFRPGGALPFLRLPLHEFTGGSLPLDSLFGSAAGKMGERLAFARTLGERISVLERFLLDRLPSVATNANTVLSNGLRLIVRAKGQVPMSRLSRELGYCQRHVVRLFQESVGVSPKLFCRMTRFIYALNSLVTRESRNGAFMAADNGYFDQAHMIREFEEFSGLPPTKFAREHEHESPSCLINTIPDPRQLVFS